MVFMRCKPESSKLNQTKAWNISLYILYCLGWMSIVRIENWSGDAHKKLVSLCCHLAPASANRGGWAGWNTGTLLYLSATTKSIWICQSTAAKSPNKVLAVPVCLAKADHTVWWVWKRGSNVLSAWLFLLKKRFWCLMKKYCFSNHFYLLSWLFY